VAAEVPSDGWAWGPVGGSHHPNIHPGVQPTPLAESVFGPSAKKLPGRPLRSANAEGLQKRPRVALFVASLPVRRHSFASLQSFAGRIRRSTFPSSSSVFLANERIRTSEIALSEERSDAPRIEASKAPLSSP
jgi:hypothetical protein